MKVYPDLVCSDCAEEAGGKLGTRAADWRVRQCDVCRKHALATSPSDYGYPRFEGFGPRVIVCPPGYAFGAAMGRLTAKPKGRKGPDTG